LPLRFAEKHVAAWKTLCNLFILAFGLIKIVK